MSSEDFFVALNYQLIHLIDFLPTANWSVHQNDTSFIIFATLYDLLKKDGLVLRSATPRPSRIVNWRVKTTVAAMATRIPVGWLKVRSKSIARFSEDRPLLTS